MATDNYRYLEAAGPDYREGGPLLLAFHGTGGGETQFLDLARQVFPEAIAIAPRGDVSENGMLRFFRRTGEGVYDMQDLADRTGRMADFIRAHAERLRPAATVGMGYSNGANILTSVMLTAPELFSHAILMHPLIPWTITPDDSLAGADVLVTAGGRDPICPPEMTGQLIEGLESRGAAVQSHWHAGGHEIDAGEIAAVGQYLEALRTRLLPVESLRVEREEISAQKGRYVVRGASATEAEMSYSRSGANTLIIDHTEVPQAFRGKGIGGLMLDRLTADAREEGMAIIPICPYAAAQFKRHPEWRDLLAPGFDAS